MTIPSPRAADATIPGGFSHDPRSAATPLASDPAHDPAATFLAPPAAEENQPSTRSSGHDEATMRTLRHPFAVTDAARPNGA